MAVLSDRNCVRWGYVCAAVLLACACAQAAAPDVVRVRFRSAVPLAAAEIRYEPTGAVVRARVGGSGFLLIERRSADAAFSVLVPGFCPLSIPAGAQAEALQLAPLIDLGGARSPLGFDARFVIAVISFGWLKCVWRTTSLCSLRPRSTTAVSASSHS